MMMLFTFHNSAVVKSTHNTSRHKQVEHEREKINEILISSSSSIPMLNVVGKKSQFFVVGKGGRKLI